MKNFGFVVICGVVFVFLFVFGLLFSTCAVNVTGVGPKHIKQHAETYATNYLHRFRGWNTPIVDCAATDTDNNGYVTCTVAESVGSQPIQIECAANIYLENTTNCRVPFMRNLNVTTEGTQ